MPTQRSKLGSVLALDIATTTGWALHNDELERPFFGAVKLPGGQNEVGKACDALLGFLERLDQRVAAAGKPISHIFWEKPFIPTQVNSQTSERLMGLCAVAQLFGYRAGVISCYAVDIAEWRKHFLGRGAGFKKGAKGKYLPGHDPKELAIQQCASFGWHTDIADAAEACGVLDYGLAMLDRGLREAGLAGYVRPWRDNTLLSGIAQR